MAMLAHPHPDQRDDHTVFQERRIKAYRYNTLAALHNKDCRAECQTRKNIRCLQSQPIISYNYGAKNASRVRAAFKLLLKVSLLYSTILWLFIICFPKVFASIFTTDATLIAFTKDALRYYLAALFMFGIQIACQMTFNALGNAPASILVAIMRKFVLLLPLIFILPHIITADKTMAVYLAEPIADVLAVTFTSILFSFQFKKALREIS